MAEQQITPSEMEQNEEEKEDESETTKPESTNASGSTQLEASTANRRKDRRKAAKKEKRKQKRKEIAEHARREEEARLEDPEYLARVQAEEEMEKERVERERREFEEREKKILADWEARQRIEEEASRRAIEEKELQRQLKQDQVGCGDEADEDGWEYVEVGPPEIIWEGNEIIVRKKKIKVKKEDVVQPSAVEDSNRPTSNPLPPQSESFIDYKNASAPSAQQLLESVAQETPNFGTEQDKAHCPFHLKTGACRFGTRCSRIHFYPDKSCTLLIKNMYNGPGLAWEQDEGLECTDEEVERAYEEFYEDVHTEFLKFGEIVNFKVCRNGSSHLRGNVYVNYKSLDSAVSAYQSVNGRYFAGKQVQCEFVGITRWKVAICGEFMKSKLLTCSRGMTCNFIHCFRNPDGDYEWADLDKPPPRYWVRKMAALFGYTDEYGHDESTETASPRFRRSSSRISKADADRYHSWRSRSGDADHSRCLRSSPEEYDHISGQKSGFANADKENQMVLDNNVRSGKPKYRDNKHRENASNISDTNRDISHKHSRGEMSSHYTDLDERSDGNISNHHGHSRSRKHRERSSSVLSTYSDNSRYGYSRTDDDKESISAHDEQSSRYDGSEEYREDKRSKRRKAKYEEVAEKAADDGGYPLNHNRSHTHSDSSSRYSHSRKNETHKSERRESNKRKSKKLMVLNFESGDEGCEGKIFTAATIGHRGIDEALEERGRWVPENYCSADE